MVWRSRPDARRRAHACLARCSRVRGSSPRVPQGLMYFLVGKRLLMRQVVAIGMLVAGALLVQFQELTRAAAAPAAAAAAGAAGGLSPAYWGAALVLFSSFISALPNVAYEKVLKTEGEVRPPLACQHPSPCARHSRAGTPPPLSNPLVRVSGVRPCLSLPRPPPLPHACPTLSDARRRTNGSTTSR